MDRNMDDHASVSDLLDERPDLESSVRAVLDVDEGTDGWHFEDVPIDSGSFGELVAYGIVEEHEQGYRVVDPNVVKTALEGPENQSDETDGGSELVAVVLRLRSLDYWEVGAVAVALLSLVIARSYVFPMVFRDSAVVLSGNDPYYYRYWVEQVITVAGGELDLSVLSTARAFQSGEPLLVAALWVGSLLLGGDVTIAGPFMAWYPVLAGICVGVLLYVITKRVTDDQRVALAALVFLSVTPVHALRTSLGFADHHAFDYFWLMTTVFALVSLSQSVEQTSRRRQWVVSTVLGLGVAGQVLSWNAGPVLLVPLGVYVTVVAFDDVRTETSPLAVRAPILSGLGLGAGLTLAVHSILGWQTVAVVSIPVLLLFGTAAVFVAGHAWNQAGLRPKYFAVAQAAVGVVGLLGVRVGFPALWAELVDGIGRIAANSDIAETRGLLNGDTFGWLLLFGFILALAIPYMIWASRESYRGNTQWLLPTVYGWYFLLLAVYQVRFAGQLAMFTALFSGLGFVHLCAAVDATSQPTPFVESRDENAAVRIPDVDTVKSVILLFLLVSGLSVVQVPIKISQVTTEGDKYRTAAWIAEYSDENDFRYPDNYVLSRWGENRMYNYFVSGQSRSYSYARETYLEFLRSVERGWYGRLNDRVGFVVTENMQLGTETMHAALHHRDGSGLGHYRAVYRSPHGEIKVFRLVSGALIAGKAVDGNATVQATTTDLKSVTYAQNGTVLENGWYVARVAYPGTYRTPSGETVRVTALDIRNGTFAPERSPRGYWTFDEGRGTYVLDQVGGNHGYVRNATWVDEGEEGALNTSGEGYAVVRNTTALASVDEFTVSVWFKTNGEGAQSEDERFPRLVAQAETSRFVNTSGYQLALYDGQIFGAVGEGTRGSTVTGSQVDDGQWHRTAFTWNGTHIKLYLDGELQGQRRFTGRVPKQSPLAFGATSDGENRFSGQIDTVRFYNRSLSDRAIRNATTAGQADTYETTTPR